VYTKVPYKAKVGVYYMCMNKSFNESSHKLWLHVPCVSRSRCNWLMSHIASTPFSRCCWRLRSLTPQASGLPPGLLCTTTSASSSDDMRPKGCIVIVIGCITKDCSQGALQHCLRIVLLQLVLEHKGLFRDKLRGVWCIVNYHTYMLAHIYDHV